MKPAACGLQHGHMKIFFLIDTLAGMGGTERHLLTLIAGLKDKGYTFQVFSLSPPGPPVEELKNLGVAVTSLPLGPIYTLPAISKGIKLWKWLRTGKPEILQTFHFKSDTFGVFWACLAGVKTIVSSRRDTGELKLGRHLWLNRIFNQRITHFLVPSRSVAESLQKREGIPQERVTLIYNGIDPEGIRFLSSGEKIRKRQELRIAEGCILIGSVANLRPEKGIEFLMKAVQKLWQEERNIILLLVGSGPLTEKLKQDAGELGIKERVIFTGYRSDSRELIQIMDIFCLPSFRMEGFSNALIEAMVCKRPIVATAVGGNQEALGDGKDGILVKPGDSLAIAEALRTLLDNPDKATALAENAYQRVLQNFSYSGMLEQTVSLWQRLKQDAGYRLQAAGGTSLKPQDTGCKPGKR